MAKQYYAYIPFPPCAGTTELIGGIERWCTNVSAMEGANEFVKKQIAALDITSRNADIERFQREDALKKMAELSLKLLPGPILRKAPILLKHGDVNPLMALAALNTDDYVLYVAGHCAPGADSLRETQSVRTSIHSLTAQKLLERLAGDGLPTNILNIKLLACFGGSANPYNSSQRAFSDAFWKALRGYCTELVRLTAYTEAVLLTSFYEKPETGKSYTRVTLGQPVSSNPTADGKLSSVSKKYQAKRCAAPHCRKLVMVQCSICKTGFCSSPCCAQHLDEGGLCRST